MPFSVSPSRRCCGRCSCPFRNRACSRRRSLEPALPDPGEWDPWDARKGDVVSITGAAEDYSDLDFPVDRRSAYESGNRRWVDLSGEFRGRRVYLEVYRYPTKEYLGITDAKKLTLVDVGLNEDRLKELDQQQDQTQFIEYEGKRWYYDSSRELGYFENETGEGEGLYRWLFREQDGTAPDLHREVGRRTV